jgi:hypothetical protein
MSVFLQNKINQLLISTPAGVVMLSRSLERQGYSYSLQKRYVQSNWLQSIGHGAYIRFGDQVDIFGGLYALQQTSSTPHIGGRTALNLQGHGQYLDLGNSNIVLFSETGNQLPKWFRDYTWGHIHSFFTSTFLPKDIGLKAHNIKSFSVPISSPARAILECLYLAPNHQELSECYEIMESLNNLHPLTVQSLLENCSSIKVKRLFLFLAEHFGHAWFRYINVDSVELGKGKRSIISKGRYDSKYKITVPLGWKK